MPSFSVILKSAEQAHRTKTTVIVIKKLLCLPLFTDPDRYVPRYFTVNPRLVFTG